MTYQAVLPFVYQPYLDECWATMAPELRDNTLVIDNTVHNRGIMRAHNMGVEAMRAKGADWLIIVSAAVRFGAPGGMDFIKVLEDHDDHIVIHAASDNVAGGKQQGSDGGENKVFGWHLTAFKAEVFDNIGVWDENFSPYGFDDIDLSVRIQKHYKGERRWDTYPIDVSDTTMSHSINLAKVVSPSEPKIEYFHRKWGRYHGEWQEPGYDHPFNDTSKSLAYWPLRYQEGANAEAWDYLESQGVLWQ